MSITMYGISNSGAGATGGLSFRAAVLHVSAPYGSTVTISKSGATTKSLGPERSHVNSDSGDSEYYFSITPANYGTWTVTATNNGEEASASININTNNQYDLELNVLIPSAYQAVEYIQVNGTQYIDTGVPARVQIRCEIDAQSTETSPSDQTLLGGNGSGTQNNIIAVGYNHGSNYKSYYYFIQSNFIDITGIVDTNRHTIVVNFESGNEQFIVDGIVRKQSTSTFTATTSSTTLHLFRRANGNNPFYGKLYALKIYDYLDSGNMVRDFIPCYRKSDSVAGLWDVVEKIFYTNSGTGTFIVGPDI